MKITKPLLTPPGPRLQHDKDPFMNFVFNAGLTICVLMLLFAIYRIASGAMVHFAH